MNNFAISSFSVQEIACDDTTIIFFYVFIFFMIYFNVIKIATC